MIEVRGLSYTYDGGSQPAVDDISFSVQEGEIFGFLGPSGAGKSTTQKILTGLLKHYQGEVTLLGRDLRQWQSDLYEKIGLSFELPYHYGKLTGLENLRFFRSLYSGTTRKPADLLALVGLGEDGDTAAGAYSKGMQMRLNFVRALLHDPELLFLDEPTAGLDPVNGRKLKDIVLGLKRAGKTVFLTTHDMSVADELCDRVAFIVDGKLAAVDAPRALSSTTACIACAWNMPAIPATAPRAPPSSRWRGWAPTPSSWRCCAGARWRPSTRWRRRWRMCSSA